MNRRKTYIVLLISSSLLIGACSVEKNYRVLSFFFDGVPNPGSNLTSNSPDSLLLARLDTLKSSAAILPKVYYHEPYLEKQCNICHNYRNMGKQLSKDLDLCYSCHERFDRVFKFQHGPSEGGYCSECHLPHKSDIEHLLKYPGNETCTNCHIESSGVDNIYHAISEENYCNTCHNPHGSNNHLLVRGEACKICHEDFSSGIEVLHGPVAAGNCSVCHTSHKDESPGQLVRRGQKLCIYCHNQEDVIRNEYHSEIRDTDCIECHNPHEGISRYQIQIEE